MDTWKNINNTIFLPNSYVAASIINVKNKYLGERFVTIIELNFISSMLQDEFNKNNINAYIVDRLNNDYFNYIDDVILINKNKDIDDVISFGQGILDNNIYKYLWNEKFIFENLYEINKQNIEKMENLKIKHFSNQKIKK